MAERDLLLRMRLTGAGDVTAGLSAIAGRAGLAGIAFTAFEAINQTAKFQATMLRLQTQTGATHRELMNATRGVKSMALSVGTSPTSLAQAMYHLESAGFRGKTALAALRVAAEGAKIGGADLIDTTTGMAAVMVAGYGKGRNSLEQMKSAMGALNATVGAGDMTFQDLNNSLQSGILAPFKTAGLQVKDFGAAMAVLGDNNIRGAQASTELRMAVAAIIGPSDRAKKAMKELGLGPLQLARDFRKPNGFLKAMEDLRDHLKNVHDPALRANAVMEIVGRRQAGPVLTFINGLDRLRQKYDQVGRGAHGMNAEWEATRRSWAFIIDQGKVLVDLVLLRLGDAIVHVINMVRGLVDAYRRGRTWAVLLVAALTAMATILAILAVRMVIMAAKTALFRAAMFLLNLVMDANPFGLVVLAIAGLIAAFIAVKAHGKELGDFFRNLWLGIRQVFVTGVNGIISAINWMIRKINGIKWGGVKIAGVQVIPGWGGLGIGQIGALGMPQGPARLPHPVVPHRGNRAEGGPIHDSGMYRVGERGQEDVFLPRGANVFPTDFADQIGSAVSAALAGTGLFIDGQQVGRMMIRQGNLQRAVQ